MYTLLMCLENGPNSQWYISPKKGRENTGKTRGGLGEDFFHFKNIHV